MDVGVLGAGSLGRGIAEVCALAGQDVSLHAPEATAVMDGLDAVERALGEAVEDGDLSRAERDAALDRLDGTTGLEAAIGSADVVIETSRDDGDAIMEAFASVEEVVDQETLVATGTDATRVTVAAAGLRHPERAVGIHFHAPGDSRLVEIVAADQTVADTVDRAVEFVEELSLHPVVARDVAGVVSTRLALAQEVEAMRLVSDGVTGVRGADEAMVEATGQTVGPLERADRAGLDHRLEALERLHESLGGRFEPPAVLRDLVVAGQTGAGSGEGFYDWENGAPVGSALPDPEIPQPTPEAGDPRG
jgi:3-hydroxybutyryl-CoA dehydrogenase